MGEWGMKGKCAGEVDCTGLCVPVPSSGRGENGDWMTFGFPTAGRMWGGGLLFRRWTHPGLAYFTLDQRIPLLFSLWEPPHGSPQGPLERREAGTGWDGLGAQVVRASES